MLDTKLKNRHKLAIVLIIITVMLPAFIMIGQYSDYYAEASAGKDRAEENYLVSESFLNLFVESSYVFYNTEQQDMDEQIQEEYSKLWEDFSSIYPYMDYQILDDDGKVLEKSLSDSRTKLSETDLVNYAQGIIISYNKNGKASVELVSGEYENEQEITLKKLVNNDFSEVNNSSYEYFNELDTPVSRTYMYGITEQHLDDFKNEGIYSDYYITPALVIYEMLVLVLLVCAAAFMLPGRKSLQTGEERIFHVPVELPLLAAGCMISLAVHNAGWMIAREDGYSNILDFAAWTLLFASVYWLCGCLRRIAAVGGLVYVKKYTLTYRFCRWVKKHWRGMAGWVKGHMNKMYHSLDDIDFQDKNNKIIFKIVLVNFVILLVLCSLWFFGIVGLFVYSGLLFFILRKYFNDLKDKYALLLAATNEIAEGNLDVEIKGDLGVFSPFGKEIDKIQKGFKKAVDEEVKSQKMKTELITNVSHDLKTPLTAIITYVNLLKEEKDEERRKDYIDVLERKSLRLKVLIEDLFEISKASSENVTLDLMNVDIVNLFKQVKLELDDKIQAAGLDFRMDLPEEKLVLTLDSQKTYRIFENLLVNITKYSMPHTRVYIQMAKEGQEAVIRMKNVSAAELNFNPEEITERFVRGDVSRNTEGSGLGLAIAKSFVKLQKGTLKIETEADLFKAEIRWKI